MPLPFPPRRAGAAGRHRGRPGTAGGEHVIVNDGPVWPNQLIRRGFLRHARPPFTRHAHTGSAKQRS
jgi:hypothetical protein